ncbi:unnamed protein product [Nezara viridula]|uniref:Gustatory receptor n=1 Tax=Nezara viridula TaxID=85310 RepID=A0A9P0HIF9_NEZVI|nr:unnamed protein product [Nezara viridula]
MAPFSSVLKRAILTSQLYGIFPYSLDGNLFRLSVARLVYFSSMLAVTLYWIAKVLVTDVPSYPTTAVDYTFTKVKLSVWTFTTIVTMVVMVFIGRRLNTWLTIVLKCQEIKGLSKIEFSHRYVWSLIHHLTHISVIIGKITSYDSLEYTKATYGLVGILTDSMKELNSAFSKPTLEQLEASVVAYERIASGSGELSEAYGIQLLVMVAGDFILVTSNAFLIVNETVPYRKIWFAMQCILPAMTTFRLVHACVCLVNESEEFNSLLRNTLVDRMNSNLCQSVRRVTANKRTLGAKTFPKRTSLL